MREEWIVSQTIQLTKKIVDAVQGTTDTLGTSFVEVVRACVAADLHRRSRDPYYLTRAPRGIGYLRATRSCDGVLPKKRAARERKRMRAQKIRGTWHVV